MTSQPDEIRSMADKLAVKLTTFVNNNQELCLDAVSGIQLASGLRPTIEQALRTVSDRAYAKGCADTIHHSPMFEEGFREGQESMRERAAKVAETCMSSDDCEECDSPGQDVIARQIRAMKPDGEDKK